MTKKTTIIKREGREILYSSVHTTVTLLKILIPISIIVKILAEFGFVKATLKSPRRYGGERWTSPELWIKHVESSKDLFIQKVN